MVARSRRKPLLTRMECRAVDRYAIETLKIPGIVLMENAGRNAAHCIDAWLRRRAPVASPANRAAGRTITILCGKGNNGGDGFVIARHLHMYGHTVHVELAADAESLSGDAAVNHAIIRAMGIPVYPLLDLNDVASAAAARWRQSDAVVDALLGTGFVGEVRDPLARIIREVNQLTGPLVVAVDVPSGLDVDTGQAAGQAVRAQETITFLAAKAGYAAPAAREFLGRVTVVDIGAPLELILGRLQAEHAPR